MLDAVVEVIDVRTGQLVARTVRDGVMWWTGDKSLLYSIREDGLVPRAVLFAPSLVGDATACNLPARRVGTLVGTRTSGTQR